MAASYLAAERWVDDAGEIREAAQVHGRQLQRKREGKKTKTNMREAELEKYASKDKNSK